MIDGTAARFEMLTSTVRLMGGPMRAQRKLRRTDARPSATAGPLSPAA